jgi:lipopolysaccharide/colanic/teichoic acid biosynthesis glycosyltransferase
MIINGDTHQNSRLDRLEVDDVRTLTVIPRPLPTWYGIVKGLFDVSVAVTCLILFAPVIALACLAVKLTSRGPMFYCQTRLGRGAKPYTLYKIRTMTHDCERLSGACWSKPNDPRVTVVGRWLRLSHIDELPQLWNIVKGDMSLVGPRPERPEFVGQLIRVMPRYRERLYVRPGLTGMAQVQLPPDTDMASVRRKLAYDVFYVEHMTFWLDCRIFVATVLYVLGLSSSLVRRFFSLPSREQVEEAFANPPAEPVPVAELTPV